MRETQAIENVSDTALWVAIYRAIETDRPDAHFRDPLARRLAGDRGAAILQWWLFDYMSPLLQKMLAKRWGLHLKNATFKFAPPEGIVFFIARGWALAEEREQYRRMSGLALLGR